MNVNDYFRQNYGYGLLSDDAPDVSPVTANADPVAAPNFDFAPTRQQNNQALWSSLAAMGAAMLANNRGGFGNALGHGLAAQQQGYRSALNDAESDNVQKFRSGMLRDDWQAKQAERQRQAALRQSLAGIDWTSPDAYRQAGRINAQFGDFAGAKSAMEADPGRPMDRFGSTVTDNDGNIWQLTKNGPVQTGIKAQPQIQIVPAVTGVHPTMAINKNTREAFPVTAPGGAPLPVPEKPLKDVPADVLKKVGENKGALGNIDALIADLNNEAKTGGKSIGAWNYLPGTGALSQYVDPAGVPLRAKIANIRSQVVHDRSGAAVTVGEMARLKPFLPDETDSPETALKKVQALRSALGEEMRAYNSMFGPEYGYKGLAPQNRRPEAAAPASAPSAPQPKPTLSMGDVRNLAIKSGRSVADVQRDLQNKGYTVR